MWKIKNLKYAYLINTARAGWFINSGWLFFWLKYLSYSEIGIVDAIAVFAAFLLEIPFGALADLIGRKKLLVFSYILMVTGPFLMAFTNTGLQLAIGNFLFLIGYSAQSGAFDALVYDSLKEENAEGQYSKYFATATTISWVVGAISLVIGGYAFTVNDRLPFIFWGSSYFCGLIATLFLKEPAGIKRSKISLKSYFKQNIDGAKELFSKQLIGFVPFILISLGFLYFYDWSSLRPTIGKENGLDAFVQSMINAGSSIFAAFIVQIIPWMKLKVSNKTGAIILALMLAIIYLVFGFRIGTWISIPMTLISAVGALAFTWMTLIINENVDTEHRATAVSSMYMLLKIPYILLAVIGGSIIQSGNVTSMNLAIGMVILISIFFILLGVKNNAKVI